MIRRTGAQSWHNVHLTAHANVADLIDVDNALPGNEPPTPFALLRQAARDLDALAREAADRGVRVRALGSGWALTDVAVTDGWLVNTKLLNGCFDVGDRFFDDAYEPAKRSLLAIAQCGISIGELNVHLELPQTGAAPRALKTSGIGAGQTVVGSMSGNTHGAAVHFGASPDYVVGLEIVTGSGTPLWIERASQPVLNETFAAELGATLVRDDDLFDSAVVSFGAFGVITAVAIETDPLYQLLFPPVQDVPYDALSRTLVDATFEGLYHYEFVWDPYMDPGVAMVAPATRVPYEPGHPAPKPVWITRSDKGYAPGDTTAAKFFALPLVPPGKKTALQFDQYRKRCILGDTRATPGQLFTATITYIEGYTESAIGVSVTDAPTMLDVSGRVVRDMKLQVMSQVRLVHPSRPLLAFTSLGPKTAVFEYGLPNTETFRRFEDRLLRELTDAGVRYTLHWSKNAGIDAERLEAMYGAERVARWRAARERVFGGDAALMRTFENAHLARAGLT